MNEIMSSWTFSAPLILFSIKPLEEKYHFSGILSFIVVITKLWYSCGIELPKSPQNNIYITSRMFQYVGGIGVL